MSISNIIVKSLKNSSFENDGFIYKFDDVNFQSKGKISPYHNATGYYNFFVNVVLPEKNQSYSITKFEYDVNNYIGRFSKYFGQSLSYKIYFTVNNEDPEGVYINSESLSEIVEAVEQSIKKGTIEFENDKKITFDIDILQSNDRSFTNFNSEYLNFYFPLNISNAYYDGKKIDVSKFNKIKFEDFAGYLNELFIEDDVTRGRMENIIYDILEPQLKLRDCDQFIQANTYVTQLDGKDVKPSWGNFKIEDFIS